jgi:hypothetical protein
MARQITPECGGRGQDAIKKLLIAYNDDAAAVVRYCRDRPYRPHPPKTIEYYGRTYTRTELAQWLAPQLNRNAGYIRQLLRKTGDDVEKILGSYPRYTTLSDARRRAEIL